MKIDDPNVEEQWSKRKKTKHSYINKDNLRGINKSSNNEQLLKILSKNKQSKSHKSSLSKLKNTLVDSPELYLKPEGNFVVACIGRKLLYKDEYASLHGVQSLSTNLVNFVFNLFEHEHNKVQFETENTDTMIKDSNLNSKIPKVKKQFFIGSTLQDNNFNLIIVNVNSKQFSFIDPCNSHLDSTRFFKNFLQFIEIHNKKYKKNQLPTAEWQNVKMVHQEEPDIKNSGVILLNFVKQYLIYKKIDSGVDALQHRVELKHVILRKSTKMTFKCVKCGGQVNEDSMKCIKCKRSTHRQCLKVKNQFACIICDVNQESEVPVPDCAESA